MVRLIGIAGAVVFGTGSLLLGGHLASAESLHISAAVTPAAQVIPAPTTTTSTTVFLPNPWPLPKPADTPSLQAQGPSCPPAGDIIENHATEIPGKSKTYEWIDIHCGLGQSGWYWVVLGATATTVPYTDPHCYAPQKITLPGQPVQIGTDSSQQVCW